MVIIVSVAFLILKQQSKPPARLTQSRGAAVLLDLRVEKGRLYFTATPTEGSERPQVLIGQKPAHYGDNVGAKSGQVVRFSLQSAEGGGFRWLFGRKASTLTGIRVDGSSPDKGQQLEGPTPSGWESLKITTRHLSRRPSRLRFRLAGMKHDVVVAWELRPPDGPSAVDAKPQDYTGPTAPPTGAEVPDVKGLTLAAARLALRSRSLKVHHVERYHDDSVPEGRVLGTRPRAHTFLSDCSSVTLLLSSGEGEARSGRALGAAASRSTKSIRKRVPSAVRAEEQTSAKTARITKTPVKTKTVPGDKGGSNNAHAVKHDDKTPAKTPPGAPVASTTGAGDTSSNSVPPTSQAAPEGTRQ